MPRSESSYRSTYLEPKVLRPLVYPYDEIDCVRRESDASYKMYGGSYRLDYLFVVAGAPALVIEAKASERDFAVGFGEGKQHAINYNEDKKGFEGRVIPFLMVAAGDRVEMYEARVGALGVTYERVPEVLSWDELCARVRRIFAAAPAPEEAVNPAAAPVFTNIYGDVFAALKSSGRPRFRDEEAVAVLNELVLATVRGDRKSLKRTLKVRKVPGRVIADIEGIFGRYDLSAVEGPPAAYAYRQFVASYFRGVGSTKEGAEALERTGRYLTPVEIIEFMVKLAGVTPGDRVIDPACGSGGFLGGVLGEISEEDRYDFAVNNLVACEVDAFCADAAKTFVDLLVPGPLRRLNIFHHNGLYAEKRGAFGDISHTVKPGSFTLVIGNPPANAKYSGGPDASFVAEKLKLPPKFGDGEAFLARAMELSAPGGRVVLVVPDGLLANIRRDQELRNAALEYFLPIAIVSLPSGVFRPASSKMSVLFLKNVAKRYRKESVFMARIESGIDPSTAEERLLSAELEAVLTAFESAGAR